MTNATAPTRVTLDDIEAHIASEHYFTAADGRTGAITAGTYEGRESPKTGGADLQPLGLLTFCVLVLQNGFTVTGQSACADPTAFDAAIGRRVARQNAINQVWPLMGYALRSRMHEAAYD
ncbi:Gp49 family protein [Vandammella animalimorsus]|nr:Gp49 family protein [Vandammella animalimorsus]